MNRPKPPNDPDQQHSEAETIRRRDEAVRRALNTPPKPLKDVVAERKAGHGHGKLGPKPSKK
jgi:hypothetical protein